MKRALTCLLSLLPLAGCGVLLPYMYDAQKLQDRLAVPMPKEQVLKRLGSPDRVVQDDGQQTIWEYRLYPRGEWAGYLVHCPFFPNCYFPAEPANPYYLVLQENQLCMWGTPDVVRSLAWKVCGKTTRSETSKPRQDLVRGGLEVSVIPVFMPPLITPLPERLAILPVAGTTDNRIISWLDLTLNFLRTRHHELVLVEREDLRTVLDEVGMQYTGRVDEDTTIRVGKLVGADALLTYRLAIPEDSWPVSASFEVRLLKVESGTTVFRQIASSTNSLAMAETAAGRLHESPLVARRLVVDEAAAYGLAALMAAFGDNPLGMVVDYSWPGEGVKLLGLLQGGPAFQAGLKPGDQILALNGHPLVNWADPVSLPAYLTVKRDGENLEIGVRPRQMHDLENPPSKPLKVKPLSLYR
jgi:PDZ domain-containing protein